MTHHSSARGRVNLITAFGVLLLVAGLSCLGYVGYQYWGTSIVSARAQAAEKETLRSEWDEPSGGTSTSTKQKTPKIAGEAFALLRIPAFGKDYEQPILVGTDTATLAKGVGWFEHTGQPGATGNFALAAHRITHGEPFAKLLDLPKGATVIVETRRAVHTYVIDEPASKLTVRDTETWVIAPNPDKPGKPATKAMITLTTCQDLFHSPDRSVAFGTLKSTEQKT